MVNLSTTDVVDSAIKSVKLGDSAQNGEINVSSLLPPKSQYINESVVSSELPKSSIKGSVMYERSIIINDKEYELGHSV